jgi:hypothetical protein
VAVGAAGTEFSGVFFPQELPLDAPGMNLDVEFLLRELAQLREVQRRLRFSHCE